MVEKSFLRITSVKLRGKFDEYCWVKFLGRGAFGTVHLVTRNEDRKEFA